MVISKIVFIQDIAAFAGRGWVKLPGRGIFKPPAQPGQGVHLVVEPLDDHGVEAVPEVPVLFKVDVIIKYVQVDVVGAIDGIYPGVPVRSIPFGTI